MIYHKDEKTTVDFINQIAYTINEEARGITALIEQTEMFGGASSFFIIRSYISKAMVYPQNISDNHDEYVSQCTWEQNPSDLDWEIPSH